jgi:hypothetical protein
MQPLFLLPVLLCQQLLFLPPKPFVRGTTCQCCAHLLLDALCDVHL